MKLNLWWGERSEFIECTSKPKRNDFPAAAGLDYPCLDSRLPARIIQMLEKGEKGAPVPGRAGRGLPCGQGLPRGEGSPLLAVGKCLMGLGGREIRVQLGSPGRGARVHPGQGRKQFSEQMKAHITTVGDLLGAQ